MLGKLTHAHTHSFGHTHILAHKDHPSFSVKAFLEQSHESRGVSVCVCPSGVKPGVFSIKAIHPLWQLSALAPFQLSFFFFSNLVNSVCGLLSCFFQTHTVFHTHTHTHTQSISALSFSKPHPLNKYKHTHTQTHTLNETSKHTKCSVTERRHRAVKLFNSPSQTILHIRESEGGEAGGYSWVPLARIECYKDQQVIRTHTQNRTQS